MDYTNQQQVGHLGDNLSAADYPALYGDHLLIRSSRRAHMIIGAGIAGLVLAFALVAGRDAANDATNIAQDEQVAHEKALAVSHMVCSPWICQKYHDHEPCGRNSNTACAKSADLRVFASSAPGAEVKP